MKPTRGPPAPPLRLDLLARLENLIEGLGQAVRMAVGSLLVAPLQYLRASPPASVRRAVRRQRILPPLLFLLLACFGLVEFDQLMKDVAIATSADDALQQHWQEIRRLDPWMFVGRAGGLFVLLWIASEAAASALTRLLARPREPLRHAALYLCGIAVLCLGLGYVVVNAAIVGGPGTVYVTPTFLRLSIPLTLTLFAVPLVLAAGLGLYAARRLRRRGRLPGGRTGHVASFGVVLGLPLLLAALFGLAVMASDQVQSLGRALSLTAWADAGTDRLRKVLMIDAQRCVVAGADLRCTVLLRLRATSPVLLDDVLSAELRRAGQQEPALPLPVGSLAWRPQVGAGYLLRLTASEPTPVSLTIAGEALCEAMSGMTEAAIGASDWSLSLEFSGHYAGGDSREFETYRLSITGLESRQVAEVHRRC